VRWVSQGLNPSGWLNYPASTPSTTSYTAGALNRYTAVGAVTPTYDGNSNLTFDGTFNLGYDAENRLISASGAGNTASYAFDAQGRRKTKTVNGTTVFVTDADNREVLEYDGSTGAIQRWYTYALGPNDVVNQTNVAAGTRTALIPDIQGSIIAALDSGSGALTQVGYQPYGKSPSQGPFGYTGQRIDLETNGLYYYRGRHYSPAWGRFLQVDPSGTKGGVNLYAYAKNDPLNLVDTTGRAPDAPSSASTSLQNFNFGATGEGQEEVAAEEAEAPVQSVAPRAPDFVVTSGGDVIPVPQGATGPNETTNPGFQFNGGAGGNGLAPNVTDVRIMESNARNPSGYVNYGSAQTNGGWQSVDPYTGQSIPPSSPWWHIPINTGQ